MKKVISYSFFTPKKFNDNKFYDKHLSIDRYWYNIPAIIALNKIFYPDFEIRFYISPDIKENPLYKILEHSSNKFNSIVIEEMEHYYEYTKPTIWRYKNLIESSVDILLPRDIDSIPNEDEIRSTLYFINNDKYKISTIRSHKYHNCSGTIMLAGLCGFRPSDLNYSGNFDDFYNEERVDNWGIDQNFIIKYLKSKGNDWISKHFIDSMITKGDNIVNPSLLKCDSYEKNFYKEMDLGISDNYELLNILNNYVDWPGEPVNFRGDILKRILEFDNYEPIKIIRDIIINNKELNDFYLLCL